MDSNESLSPQQFHFQDSYWGNDQGYDHDDQDYTYSHDSNGQLAYIYDINNDNEHEQYHYPQKDYSEYLTYHYEGEQESSLSDTEEGMDESCEVREGLLCEEDENDAIFDDGLTQ